MAYYSQYGQDQYLIENYFKGQSFGYYVDVGAHDGVTLSNTKAFEELGWEGICFEPQPKAFKKLQESRSCLAYNYAVTNNTGTVDFLLLEGFCEQLSGIAENYHQSHSDWIKRENQSRGLAQETIKVESRKFSDIVTYKQIDYVSIDVEGSEMSVLESIDFNKHDIKLLGVENNYNEPHIYDFLATKGYRPVFKIAIDVFFEKR